VRFTSADQLLSKVTGRPEAKSFSLRLEVGPQARVALTYRKAEGKGFEIESVEYAYDGLTGRITEQLSHDEIAGMLSESERTFAQRLRAESRLVVYRERCFLAFALAANYAPGELLFLSPPFHGMMIIPELKGLIHVPAVRGNPERTYSRTSAVGPNFEGTFVEHYVASVISNWQETDKAALGQLGEWLEDLGLTWKVDAKSLDDTSVELRVGRLVRARRGGARDVVNVADAGFGLSQVLPVLVALLAARPGQLVYLEEPEIHLHPLAQRRLAGILAASAKRGVRLVVETHSALVLREIQTMVARGELAADLVKLHWFKRSPDDGVTKMFTADLDQNGAYGDWPEDFDEVHLDAEKAYLDAVEGKAATS